MERLVEDVGDEPVGAARIVDIVVVAQGEIAELHPQSPTRAAGLAVSAKNLQRTGRRPACRHDAA